MKRLLKAVASISCILTLLSCSENTSSTADAKNNKIGVLIFKYDNDFMSFVRRGIEAATENKANIIMQDSQNDQAKQNEQVDTLIAKGVKALAVNLVDPQAAQTIASKAQAADIPVVFFNKEPDIKVLESCAKCYYLGTTESEAAVMQSKLIIDSWKAHPEFDKNKDGIIQYMMIKGEPGHAAAEARTKVTIEELEKSGLKVQQLDLQTAMWDAVKAKDLMDAWLSKYGDKIEYVISNNDSMALGAISSLQSNGYFNGSKKIMPVVGVDAVPDALTKIKDNTLIGTVLNDAKGQGVVVAKMAMNLAENKPADDGLDTKLVNKSIRIPYIQINKDNLAVAEKSYQ